MKGVLEPVEITGKVASFVKDLLADQQVYLCPYVPCVWASAFHQVVLREIKS